MGSSLPKIMSIKDCKAVCKSCRKITNQLVIRSIL